MSQPVFLNALSMPRMPDGSKNEWKAFWADGGVELEGNGWPPLLWIALFKLGDMRQARMVDDEDLDSEGREELEAFGDASYPYLVASTDRALATLASRKPVILDGIGETYAPVVEAFETFLGAKFPRFVLCRTSGMADATDAGPALERALSDFDRLASGSATGEDNVIVKEMQSFRTHRAWDPIYLLGGTGGDAWPPQALADAFPRAAQPAAKREKKPSSLKKELRDWGLAVVVALPTAAVYLFTHSIAWAVLCFCVLCAAVGIIVGKRLR